MQISAHSLIAPQSTFSSGYNIPAQHFPPLDSAFQLTAISSISGMEKSQFSNASVGLDSRNFPCSMSSSTTLSPARLLPVTLPLVITKRNGRQFSANLDHKRPNLTPGGLTIASSHRKSHSMDTTGFRTLPVSSSPLPNSESFELLKESIFDGYYRSHESRVGFSGDWAGYNKPRSSLAYLQDDTPENHDRPPSFRPGIRATVSFSIVVDMWLPSASSFFFHSRSDHTIKTGRRRALIRPAMRRCSSKPVELETQQGGDQIVARNLPGEEKKTGLPEDMLDLLGGLEMLAVKVESMGKYGVESTGYNKNPKDNTMPATPTMIAAGKVKQLTTSTIVSDVCGGNLGTDTSTDTSCLPLNILKPIVGSSEHFHIYNPCDAPEFLAGSSNGLIVQGVDGYHSKPAVGRPLRTASRKMSLPSLLPHSLRKKLGPASKDEHYNCISPKLPSSSPLSMSPRSLPAKSSSLKALLQRSRPRSRSDVLARFPKIAVDRACNSSIPSSHHPVESSLNKSRLHWLKI